MSRVAKREEEEQTDLEGLTLLRGRTDVGLIGRHGWHRVELECS